MSSVKHFLHRKIQCNRLIGFTIEIENKKSSWNVDFLIMFLHFCFSVRFLWTSTNEKRIRLFKVCLVWTNMCNIIFQRLPAVLSRIGVILASPLVSYYTWLFLSHNLSRTSIFPVVEDPLPPNRFCVVDVFVSHRSTTKHDERKSSACIEATLCHIFSLSRLEKCKVNQYTLSSFSLKTFFIVFTKTLEQYQFS